jgi:hypothetical protein
VAIHVLTAQPEQLLQAIRYEIAEGHISTWARDEDGDFTHTHTQWQKRAWLRPQTLVGELRLNIIAPLEHALTTEMYAIYHGRFIEMLLAHFDNQFYQANASALPDPGDIVGA